MIMIKMMNMMIICSIFTLIRLCRPRPGYTIAKVQVSHSTTMCIMNLINIMIITVAIIIMTRTATLTLASLPRTATTTQPGQLFTPGLSSASSA